MQACLRLLVTREDICTTAGYDESTDAICLFIGAQSSKTVLLPIVPVRKGKLKLKVRLTTDFSGEDVETFIFVEVGVQRLHACLSKLIHYFALAMVYIDYEHYIL